MDVSENHHHHLLLRPLIHHSATSTAEHRHNGIILRLSLVALVGVLSIYANHEESKGFSITILNEAADTFLGKRFDLFYMSNDEATRVVIRASQFVEGILYPNESHIKKKVKHITVKLVGKNSTDKVVVDSDGRFVMNISPRVMEGTNFGREMFLAVQKGVARVWLWDGEGQAPECLVNGIVDYIVTRKSNSFGVVENVDQVAENEIRSGLGATVCWKGHEDCRSVAKFVEYCERRRPGFISKLNQVMEHDWHDDYLNVVLGLPVQDFCTNYYGS